MSGDADFVRRLVGRCVSAAALGFAERACRSSGGRRAPAAGRVSRAGAVVLAGVAPALVTTVTVRRTPTAWRLPRTLAGRVLVALHLVSGVVIEELLWRAPLLYLRPRPALAAGASLSLVGFAALHLRRDGLHTAWIHVPTAAGLTLATLVGGQLRPAVLAHTLYNVVAVCLVGSDDNGGPA